jgi:hypothetical protein
MPDQVSLKVNGASISVPPGTTVAVAMELAVSRAELRSRGNHAGRYVGWASASSAG